MLYVHITVIKGVAIASIIIECQCSVKTHCRTIDHANNTAGCDHTAHWCRRLIGTQYIRNVTGACACKHISCCGIRYHIFCDAVGISYSRWYIIINRHIKCRGRTIAICIIHCDRNGIREGVGTWIWMAQVVF